ncbi:MAG TPA: ImcF-related family protein [Terracidiphilus sp.]
MLAYILAVVVLLVAALLAFGLAALLHLQGAAYLVFVILVLLIGIAAAITIVVMHLRAKKEKGQQGEEAGTAATAELDLMLNDANRKLRSSQQGAKAIDALPLLYILGDSGSAKTTTVLKSGLDPELLAGTATLDGDQVPTNVINLWFTKAAALLEIGASVRPNNTLLGRLVHRTRARAYRSAFGSGAAPRAVIVCVSADQLLVGDAGQSLMASARATGAQLREVSRILGMPLPVYVIVTKLDRVPHFAEYVRNLSDAEVRQVLGVPLPRSDASAGVYAEQASRLLAGIIDGLVYQLGEFRVEMLDRENDPRNVSGVYEFPRELGKVRKNLNQYLVELCKPSQLSANPYLRGFYFTGIRARIVERAVSAPAAAEPRHTPQDAGATQYINLSMGRAAAPAAAPAPVMTQARVPQWTFLPRLLPEVILGDRSALTATRQSAPARLFRRILYGTLAFLFALYTIFLIVSYINNAAIEHRIQDDARALPVTDATGTSMAGPKELSALDDLRLTILQLDDWRQNGPHLSYRFGLYQGDKLEDEARKVYFDRFRPMLLNPAQNGFLASMRGLPDAPANASDFSLYNAAYNPLKAYLVTTSNPDKCDPKFLTPAFFQYWIGSRTDLNPEQQDLAKKQIDFYGNELLHHPPYSITVDSVARDHTRSYLHNFLGVTRVYQAMLADGDKAGQTIDFNKQYPGSASYVVDPKIVRGAFSKDGFAFMQNAVQHPDKYAAGETWVLGDAGGQALSSAVSGSALWSQYSADFLKEWRAYLSSARVVNCTSLKDASMRLGKLTEPASPLLELFYLVSHNTAVNDPQIKKVFQPAQAFVDANSTDRLIGDGNKTYITALSNLGGAIDLATATKPVITDPVDFAPISVQVTAANGAVQQVQQGFNVDPDGHVEKLVINLLKQPIDCVDGRKPQKGGAANGAGKNICNNINPLLSKFPFVSNVNAPQAALSDVDRVFAPGTGVIWTALAGDLKDTLALSGTQYVAAPAAPGPVNQKFLSYFNRAAHLSTSLYQGGAKSASFSFNLRFISGNGVNNATVVMDGLKMPSGSTPQTLTWNGANAQSASLLVDGQGFQPWQGTWSIFQLVRSAQITHTGGGYRLDYILNNALTLQGRAATGTGSSSRMATFELSGPGADLLVGDGFTGLTCAQPVILGQ